MTQFGCHSVRFDVPHHPTACTRPPALVSQPTTPQANSRPASLWARVPSLSPPLIQLRIVHEKVWQGLQQMVHAYEPVKTQCHSQEKGLSKRIS